ncbi:TPA: hypothetical protein ACH3X1_004487 [Trebouxia sp. C0004]
MRQVFTRPRPVQVVFSSLIHRHIFLRFSKDFRQAVFRLDDDLTRSQQTERNTLSLDFRSLKTKGYQPYFRGSLLEYHSENKTHTCGKGTESQQLHKLSAHTLSRIMM